MRKAASPSTVCLDLRASGSSSESVKNMGGIKQASKHLVPQEDEFCHVGWGSCFAERIPWKLGRGEGDLEWGRLWSKVDTNGKQPEFGQHSKSLKSHRQK